MTDSLACLRCKARFAMTRGVCMACRQAIRHAIRQGKTTEATEIAAGRILERKDGENRQRLGRRRF